MGDLYKGAFEDLEDMTHAKLKLKPGVTFGLWELGGKSVTLHQVDPNGSSHDVTVDDLPNLPVRFSNDEDVYE